ncbi:hypothetical protein TNCV_642671 [Trichonephila clavipes]|nr:hypothetical protein TNCV_642671 [Trichonephila clavipes]
MIEIYKSHGRYYIFVPKVAFPTFVENYVLPCRVGTLLEFAFFTDAPPVFSLSNLNVPRGWIRLQTEPSLHHSPCHGGWHCAL